MNGVNGIINVALSDDFTIVDGSGTRYTGVTGFTFELWNPANTNVAASIVPTVAELGTGSYRVTFTPNALGLWKLVVYHASYFPAGKEGTYQIYTTDVDAIFEAVENIDDTLTNLISNLATVSEMVEGIDDESIDLNTIISLCSSTGIIQENIDDTLTNLITNLATVSELVEGIDDESVDLNTIISLISSTGHISTTVDDILAGGASLDAQAIRDAMMLAPTTATSATNSVDNKLDTILTAAGVTGSSTITITITDNDIPIQDVYVEIWNSGLTAIVTYGITDSNGQVQKTTIDGTYKVKVRKGGYSFNDPFDLTVSGDTTVTYEGITYVIEPASDLSLCRIYGYIVNGKKEGIEGVTVSAVPYDSPTLIEGTNSVVSPETIEVITISTGEFVTDLIRNVKYTINISEIGFRKTVLIPNETGPVILWSLTDVFVSSDPAGNNPNW